MSNQLQPQDVLRIRPRDDPYQASPHIENREIFAELIAEEIRSGRLTTERRRRIVRYAAGMGLSAVEAGRLMDACREEALQSEDAVIRGHALRLVEPPLALTLPWWIKAAIASTVTFALYALIRRLTQ